jgi:hypothetical protein
MIGQLSRQIMKLKIDVDQGAEEVLARSAG